MPDPISILDIIKKGGYEASLITTFNAHLPFYEEVVLRKLVSAGCRHNVVIMDKSQCAKAWSSESSRPRLAGHAYTLMPIGVTGAFHPKICVLVGPKKATILVGSHNLTLSGFGYNREISNLVEVTGIKDKEGCSVLADVWGAIKKWVELERDSLPDALLESVIALGNFIAPLTASADESSEVSMIYQTPGELPLIDQLAKLTPPGIHRISVLGAFFDRDFLFIKELSSRWPAAEVVVGIDPETVHLIGNPSNLDAKFVDAHDVCDVKPNAYLHAKILYIETLSINGLYLSGSANPSRPAWMGNKNSCNVEAMLIRRGSTALDAADATGISKLYTLPSIDKAVFEKISDRSQVVFQENLEETTLLLHGIAKYDPDELSIASCNGVITSSTIEIYGADMSLLTTVHANWNSVETLCVRIDGVLKVACSCKLLHEGKVVGQVMIHHPDVILASSKSSKQSQIKNALSALGASSGDISSVIASVEKIIFSEDTHLQVVQALNERKFERDVIDVKVPDTLAVHVANVPKIKKKHQILKSGDLAYLLDILIRRLGEGLVSSSIETDAAGRSEEEQIGKDDEYVEEPNQQLLAATSLTDLQIAIAVSRRAHQLIKKMCAQLERASSNNELQITSALQLIAVIGLIRELRHLDNMPRWKNTGTHLSSEINRRILFNQSVKYLFGESKFLHKLQTSSDFQIDELFRLKILLLWLAWDIGFETSDQIGRLWDKDEKNNQLQANAFFVEILPSLVSDDEARLELEAGISRTVRKTPIEAHKSQVWLNKHWDLGHGWISPLLTDIPIKIGSYCLVPGIIDTPRVVIEIPNGFVGLWDFDRIRTFEKNRVKGVISQPL